MLEWPQEWGPERLPGKLIAALVVFGLGALISIPYSIDFASRGNWLRVAFGVTGGIAFLSVVLALAPHVRVRRKTLPRNLRIDTVDEHGDGLRIEVKFSWRPMMILWLIAAAVFLVIRGVLFFTHISADDSTRSGVDVGGLLIVVVVLGMIAFLIFYSFGRGRRYFFAISEYGISQGLGHTVKTIPWGEVGQVWPVLVNNTHMVRIAPVAGVKVHVNTGRSLVDRLQRSLMERSVDLPASALSIDPPLLLHLVRYYWQHPKLRNELESDAVIDRIRRGELTG
ncbi:hypothetical protein CRH09_07415 [Nocardia terpenica]|uniref:Uncharacterized protein n=2 Tax=Nocardia terpenica TaxID=455432 RepID=A0A291RG06_9NOCA|nr:hypothetical protein CRH09_07415 [Nocardia terpenica]